MKCKVEGAVRRTDAEDFRCAINPMKIGEASGLSGFVLEMFYPGEISVWNL